MLKRIDLMAIRFYDKEAFTGSLDGMRFRIKLVKEEEPAREYLQVVLYPDVNCFDKTPDSLKQFYEFPFTEDGLNEIADFLNRQAVEQSALWRV